MHTYASLKRAWIRWRVRTLKERGGGGQNSRNSNWTLLQGSNLDYFRKVDSNTKPSRKKRYFYSRHSLKDKDISLLKAIELAVERFITLHGFVARASISKYTKATIWHTKELIIARTTKASCKDKRYNDYFRLLNSDSVEINQLSNKGRGFYSKPTSPSKGVSVHDNWSWKGV